MNKLQAENYYTDKILELIYNQDDFTTSDLQGVITALVQKIARDEDLLTFDERLERSKAVDLL